MIDSAIQCVKDAKEISENTKKYGHDGPFCAQCVAEGGLYAIANWPEVKALITGLYRISGMAGIPNAEEACRLMVRECVSVLDTWKEQTQEGK